jgi:trigger factor
LKKSQRIKVLALKPLWKLIQNIINQILESKSEKVPVFEDRPAQEKDLLDINFEGFLSPEEPLPNGAANNFILELGSQSFIPGFEEGLIGAKAGSERTLDLSFPEDYQAAEIAGKNVSFKVKINKILKKQLPALDDQLVESLGDPKIKTAEQLKEGIASDLLKSEEDQSIKAMQEEVLKALIENNPMELPESLVAQQKEGLKANSKQTLVAQGFGEAEMDDYYKKWDEDFTKNARDIIHVSLLMDAIADSEKLRPTEKEIDEKIQEMANQAGPNGSKVKEYYSDINRKDSLYYKLMEDRVISYVIENSKIKEA